MNKSFDEILEIRRHSAITSSVEVAKKELGYDLEKNEFIKVIIQPEGNQYYNLDEVVQIQNIFWLNGMAPRIKKIVKVNYDNEERDALVMGYLPKVNRYDYVLQINKIKQICNDNFIQWNDQGEDQELHDIGNWIKDRFIDYGGFKFIDKQKYIDKLNKKIESQTHFGKSYEGRKARYQSDDGLDGKRKTQYRIDKMKLKDIDFNNKTVLDIGCNLGMFSQYAKKRGAANVIGFDINEDIIHCAKEYANIKGIYDIEFLTTDIDWDRKHKRPKMPSADIVFYLAMSQYLGFDPDILNLANEILIYEGHADEDAENTKKELLKVFPIVEDLGYTDDRSIRPIFICRKK